LENIHTLIPIFVDFLFVGVCATHSNRIDKTKYSNAYNIKNHKLVFTTFQMIQPRLHAVVVVRRVGSRVSNADISLFVDHIESISSFQLGDTNVTEVHIIIATSQI